MFSREILGKISDGISRRILDDYVELFEEIHGGISETIHAIFT